jgi:hypothetical protein
MSTKSKFIVATAIAVLGLGSPASGGRTGYNEMLQNDQW